MKEEIIQDALIEANLGLQDVSSTDAYSRLYDLTLHALIEKHNFIFSYGVASNLSEAIGAEDLGYRYKYTLSADVLDIVEINPANDAIFGSVREALRFGTAATREEIASQGSTSALSESYIKIGNVLHSDVQVSVIVYKKGQDDYDMTATFKNALTLELAKRMVRADNPDNMQLFYSLRKDAKEALGQAIIVNTRPPQDPQLRALFDWYKTYYITTASRY